MSDICIWDSKGNLKPDLDSLRSQVPEAALALFDNLVSAAKDAADAEQKNAEAIRDVALRLKELDAAEQEMARHRKPVSQVDLVRIMSARSRALA
jgi:hypothetical protein